MAALTKVGTSQYPGWGEGDWTDYIFWPGGIALYYSVLFVENIVLVKDQREDIFENIPIASQDISWLQWAKHLLSYCLALIDTQR